MLLFLPVLNFESSMFAGAVPTRSLSPDHKWCETRWMSCRRSVTKECSDDNKFPIEIQVYYCFFVKIKLEEFGFAKMFLSPTCSFVCSIDNANRYLTWLLLDFEFFFEKKIKQNRLSKTIYRLMMNVLVSFRKYMQYFGIRAARILDCLEKLRVTLIFFK